MMLKRLSQATFRFLVILTGMAVFAFTPASPAAPASNKNSADVLEAKKMIETMISSRFEQALQTRLSKTEFTVSTQVELVKKAAPTVQLPAMPKLPDIQIEAPKKQVGIDSFLPSTTGLIDAERILESYQNDIHRAQAQAQQTQAMAQWQASVEATLKKNDSELAQNLETLSRYEVSQVSVSIGLKDTLSEDYRKTLEGWAKSRILFEFGKLGSTDVHFIQKPFEKPETTVGLMERLETFFSIALIGLIAFICFMAWLSYVPRLQAKAQVEAAEAANKPDTPLEVMQNSDSTDVVERPDAVTDQDKVFSEDDVNTLMGKVSRIIDTLSIKERKDMVRLLSQKNREGRIKAAYAVEAWFARHETKMATGDEELFTWLNELDLPLRRKMELISQWRELSSISLRDRGRLINELFWDLIAFKTLGSFAVEKPFEYLNDLSADEVKSLIDKKDRRTQSLVFLFLPQATQKSLLSRVNHSEQQELLKSCFTSPIVEVEMLDRAHADLKIDVSRSLDRKISVIDRLGDLLSQMDVLDELTMLRQTIAQFGNEGLQFKQRYPTLAFIDEWTDRVAMQTLASDASSDEIVSLISEFPQIEERMLAACSPMIAEIVRDDVARGARQQRATRRTELASLTAKLKVLVSNGKISYENLFIREKDNVIQLVA
jgi:hypothetical protein